MPKPAPKAFAAKKTAVPALEIGDKMPDFSLPSTGGTISAAALRGKPAVIYFYPKDDTSGCTAEACGFRDDLPAFKKLGAAVIGISKDNLKRHDKFIAKYDLNFPLASDETGEVLEKFGVWIEKSMYGRKYMGIERATFLFDAKGVLRAVWRKVSVPGHVEAVRAALNDLKA